VDGVHLLPAQVVQDEQVSAGAQDPRQFGQRGGFVPEVGEGVVADHPVKGGRREGQVVGISLDQPGLRRALSGPLQHPVGQVHRDLACAGGALPQERDERPGAGADLQDRLRLLEKVAKGFQQPPQPFLPVRRLLGIPFFGQSLKEGAQFVHYRRISSPSGRPTMNWCLL
jgi:hypothetical protein